MGNFSVVIKLRRCEIENVVFRGICHGAILSNLLVLVGIEWLQFYINFGVLYIDINLYFKRKVNLSIAVVSGKIALMIKWCDET